MCNVDFSRTFRKEWYTLLFLLLLCELECKGDRVPEGTILPRVAVAYVGQPMRMICYSASPAIWELNEWLNKDAVIQNNTIYVKSAKTTYIGVAVCLGTYSNTTSFMKTAPIFVGRQNPDEDVTPRYLEVVAGEGVTFTKPITGHISLPVWSFLHGVMVPEFPYVVLAGAITLKQVNQDLSGKFVCYYTHTFKYVRRHFLAIVELKVFGHREKTKMYKGEKYVLSCGNHTISNVHWTFNLGPLKDNTKVINGKLVIANSVANNEGKYICEGHLSRKYLYTGRNVLYAGMHILHFEEHQSTLYPSSQTVFVGGQARFMCDSQGSKQWKFMDKELPPNAYLTDRLSRILIIRNAKLSNIGVYKCVFKNEKRNIETISGALHVIDLKENLYTVCPSPVLDHGRVTVTPRPAKSGSIAIYECDDENAPLLGPKVRTCQPDGTWSGRQPSCKDYGASAANIIYNNRHTIVYIFIWFVNML